MTRWLLRIVAIIGLSVGAATAAAHLVNPTRRAAFTLIKLAPAVSIEEGDGDQWIVNQAACPAASPKRMGEKQIERAIDILPKGRAN